MRLNAAARFSDSSVPQPETSANLLSPAKSPVASTSSSSCTTVFTKNAAMHRQTVLQDLARAASLPVGHDDAVETGEVRTRSSSPSLAALTIESLPQLPLDMIVHNLDLTSLNKIRQVNRDFGKLGAEHFTHIEINNQQDLRKALHAFQAAKIDSLYLNGEFTDADLVELPTMLTKLDLSCCQRITAIGLANLPNKLQYLNLSFCSGLTSAPLDSLPRTLQKLNLGSCIGLTDTALGRLAQTLPQLKELNLSFCRHLGDAALANLPPKLQQLALEGCHRFTPAALARLPRSLPELDLFASIGPNGRPLANRLQNATA